MPRPHERGFPGFTFALVLPLFATAAGCFAPAQDATCQATCGICERCIDGRCRSDAVAANQPLCVAERIDPCDGLDNDANGIVDDPDTCWSPVYAFTGPGSAPCFGTDPRRAPAGCDGHRPEREAPAFWLAAREIPGTVALRQCSRGEDHVIVADLEGATEGYVGPDRDEPVAAWEALGYDCGAVLGRAWADAAVFEGVALPYGAPCVLARHATTTPEPGLPVGLHDATLGTAAAMAGATCEPSAQWVVAAAAPTCAGGETPPSCLTALCSSDEVARVAEEGSAESTRPDRVVAPGETFEHVFEVENIGDTPWETTWLITPIDRPEAAPIPLGGAVAPGGHAQFTVGLTAPMLGIDLRDDWELRPAPGAPAVLALPFQYDVDTEDTAELMWVTPPATTPIGPQSYLSLGVALRNTGVNDGWAGDWTLIREEGAVSRQAEVPLPSTINPNATLRILIPAVAPHASGTYLERWHLERPDGTTAPVDWGASFSFDVQVSRIDAVARLVSESIPDGTPIPPGVSFIKMWTVENVGTSDWEAGWHLTHVAGALSTLDEVTPGVALDAGETYLIAIPMRVPTAVIQPSWTDSWEIRDAEGRIIPVQDDETGGATELRDRHGKGWLWAEIAPWGTCPR